MLTCGHDLVDAVTGVSNRALHGHQVSETKRAGARSIATPGDHDEICHEYGLKTSKQGDVIFETSERSDELYLIHTGSVEIKSREGLALATLKQGELFGEMASLMGERERTAAAVAGANRVIDVIDATTMQRKLGEADPVLPALIRNLTLRLADANRMNEERWQQLNIYRSLKPEEFERP